MDPEDPAPHDEFEPEGELEDDGELEYDEAAPQHTALSPKVEAWRRRSAAGAILTGFALGLQEALDSKREEPSITIQTSGDPPKDLPVEADFEYGRPRQSVVNIRPWLLNEETPAEAPGDDKARDADETRADEDPGEP